MPAGGRIVYVSSEMGRLRALSAAYRGLVTAAASLEDVLAIRFTPTKPSSMYGPYVVAKVSGCCWCRYYYFCCYCCSCYSAAADAAWHNFT